VADSASQVIDGRTDLLDMRVMDCYLVVSLSAVSFCAAQRRPLPPG